MKVDRQKAHELLDQYLDMQEAAGIDAAGWRKRQESFDLLVELLELTAYRLISERLLHAAHDGAGSDLDFAVQDGAIASMKDSAAYPGGLNLNDARLRACRMMLAKVILDFGSWLPENLGKEFADAILQLNLGETKNYLLRPVGKNVYARHRRNILRLMQCHYVAGYRDDSAADAWPKLFDPDTEFDSAMRSARPDRNPFGVNLRVLFEQQAEKGKQDCDAQLPERPPGMLPSELYLRKDLVKQSVFDHLKDLISPNEIAPSVKTKLSGVIDQLCAMVPDKNAS